MHALFASSSSLSSPLSIPLDLFLDIVNSNPHSTNSLIDEFKFFICILYCLDDTDQCKPFLRSLYKIYCYFMCPLLTVPYKISFYYVCLSFEKVDLSTYIVTDLHVQL